MGEWLDTAVSHWPDAAMGEWLDAAVSHWPDAAMGHWLNAAVSHWSDAAMGHWPDAVCSHSPAHVAASRFFGAAVHHQCGRPGWGRCRTDHVFGPWPTGGMRRARRMGLPRRVPGADDAVSM